MQAEKKVLPSIITDKKNKLVSVDISDVTDFIPKGFIPVRKKSMLGDDTILFSFRPKKGSSGAAIIMKISNNILAELDWKTGEKIATFYNPDMPRTFLLVKHNSGNKLITDNSGKTTLQMIPFIKFGEEVKDIKLIWNKEPFGKFTGIKAELPA